MASRGSSGADRLIGRNPERLSIAERFAFAGQWAAFEIYNPKDLPLRRIEAIGASAADCIAMLKARGLDPKRFEFEVLKPPY